MRRAGFFCAAIISVSQSLFTLFNSLIFQFSELHILTHNFYPHRVNNLHSAVDKHALEPIKAPAQVQDKRNYMFTPIAYKTTIRISFMHKLRIYAITCGSYVIFTFKAEYQPSSNFQIFRFSSVKRLADYILYFCTFNCDYLCGYVNKYCVFFISNCDDYEINGAAQGRAKNCLAFHRFMIKSVEEEY